MQRKLSGPKAGNCPGEEDRILETSDLKEELRATLRGMGNK
jgi:hypothetical protein